LAVVLSPSVFLVESEDFTLSSSALGFAASPPSAGFTSFVLSPLVVFGVVVSFVSALLDDSLSFFVDAGVVLAGLSLLSVVGFVVDGSVVLGLMMIGATLSPLIFDAASSDRL
jgi:hypothetical protein